MDGIEYTYNGKGEFWLLKSITTTAEGTNPLAEWDHIRIQVRLEQPDPILTPGRFNILSISIQVFILSYRATVNASGDIFVSRDTVASPSPLCLQAFFGCFANAPVYEGFTKAPLPECFMRLLETL